MSKDITYPCLESIDNLKVGDIVYFVHGYDRGILTKGIIVRAERREEMKEYGDWYVEWLPSDGKPSCTNLQYEWNLVKAEDQGKPWERLDTYAANGGLMKELEAQLFGDNPIEGE